MQWVVYGAGAVGGVLGAMLHEAGHDVVLVARGGHLEALRRSGLRVLTPESDRTVQVDTVSGAAGVDWSRPTVVLLAVKSHQTAAAVGDLGAHAAPTTPVVCVQNGVANEPAALRLFETVLGVCVMMPTGHLEAGVVEAHCSPVVGILDVGRFPSGVDALTRQVASAFESAGFVSEPRPDIMAWKHRKLIMNLGNAVQACCGPGDATAELRQRVRAEGEEVLSAARIPVISDEQDRGRRGDILQRREIAGRERSGGSSWQSLRRAAGNIEADYLNGEIVLLGRLHGVPTPANELVRRTAGGLARAGAEPGTVDAADLLATLGSAADARL